MSKKKTKKKEMKMKMKMKKGKDEEILEEKRMYACICMCERLCTWSCVYDECVAMRVSV